MAREYVAFRPRACVSPYVIIRPNELAVAQTSGSRRPRTCGKVGAVPPMDDGRGIPSGTRGDAGEQGADAPEGPKRLFGRDESLRRLDERLASVRDRGGGILVRGEPGIGKSAFLEWAGRAAEARGMRILRATGVASEMSLPFAGLHQLLRPIVSSIEPLPAPQRDAARAALGLSDDPAPGLFRVALAVLNLLGEATRDAPALLVVDDAHWLDRSSADVLGFVARRLEDEPILMLAAVREGAPSVLEEIGLPEWRLDPLAPPAARALLRERASGLTPAMRDRLVEEAAGNPLALVELPAGADATAGALPWLPLTARLERAFASRVSELAPHTRALLLVAAVNDGEAVSETLEATTVLVGAVLGAGDLAPAVCERLVEVDGSALRFRHPLIRSAIYQAAGAAQRQAAHAALAGVVAGDADRAAWHRAAASPGPDEAVALDLERAADRARRRGAVAAAIAGLERASRLSLDPALRGRRLLRAADLALELGRAGTVERLLDEAERSELTPQQHLRAVGLRWLVGSQRVADDAGYHTSAGAVAALARNAEEAAAGGDPELALRLLVDAAARSWWANTAWAGAREHVIAALERLGLEGSHPHAMVVLAMGAPRERGALLVERLQRMPLDTRGSAVTAHNLGWAASAVGALDLGAALLGQAVAGLRAQGRLGLLALALNSQAWTAFHRGDVRTALTAADESGRLAHETAQPLVAIRARVMEALIQAVRGDLDAAEAAASAVEHDALRLGANAMLAAVQHARGLVALGAGRPADAYGYLRRVHEPGDPAHHWYVSTLTVADIAEAALLSERLDAGRALIEEMEALAERTRSPVLQAGLKYARALLAPDDQAEARFQLALGEGSAGWPLLRARTELAYGRWLRRHRRVTESRPPLRAAVATFDALDARWWSASAQRELVASGESIRRSIGLDSKALTPQELQVAQMAAGGLTNREIAERLYISRRTVSTHLYRIFPKLDIAARSELPAALDALEPPLA